MKEDGLEVGEWAASCRGVYIYILLAVTLLRGVMCSLYSD